MKKLFAMILLICIVVMVCFTFVSCAPATTVDEEGNTIVKMSIMNSANENPGWLAMIEAANSVLEANGEKVRIEAEIIMTDSWDEYYTKITSNMMGKIGGTIGRIAESHVALMVEKNRLADLSDIATDLINSGEYNSTVFGGVAEKDGKYYGLPSGTQHMLLYYNKTLIDEYNAAHPDDVIKYPSSDWTAPSTFEEISSTASKLTGGTGTNKYFGISAGPYLAYAGMYAKNSGGDNIFNEAGECIINTQAYYDVYEWFEQMLLIDKSMPSTADTATSDSVNRFLAGNVAMLIDGVWQIHDICKYTGDFEIGVAAIPVSTNGYSAYSTTFVDRFWAARNSTHPEEDKIALRALMSKEAILALSSQQVGGFPVRNDCVDNYVSSLNSSKLSAYVNVIKEGRERGVNVPYSTYYNIVDQQINQKLGAWINGDVDTDTFVKFMYDTMIKGMNGEL